MGHDDRDRLLDDLQVDVRHLDVAGPAERPIGDGVFQNLWGERYVYRPTPWGPMREDVHGELVDAQSLDDLKDFPWPSPDQLDYASLADACRRYEPYALQYGFADVWQRPGWSAAGKACSSIWSSGPTGSTSSAASSPTSTARITAARRRQAAGGSISYLLISDLGSQGGPLISRTMFREFVTPYIREMADCIHGLGGKVLFHSCGSISSLIPDLIEPGRRRSRPDPAARSLEMSPERLKANFGDRLCFHGGIDMQRLLPHGSPEEVRAEVCRYCQTLGRDGGYILGPAHLFQPDVPPENILAVYDA